MAAVIVSVVHVTKGESTPPFRLDDREVGTITAFLFHAGGHEDPKPLKENEGRSFIGSYVLGMGFTFDDTNPDATPTAEMHRLIEKAPRNAERIFPYLGGEELNTSPTHAHRRYVINFGKMTEGEAQEWPDLVAILRERVRPERAKKSREIAAAPWWQFWRSRPELSEATGRLQRLLAVARVADALAFAFIPARSTPSDQLVVFTDDRFGFFSVLQSRVHDTWARFSASTMKDDLRYTPSDCFEPFPFPASWDMNLALEGIGRDYYEFRAALMARNDEGMTKTYNRLHDPNETSPEILRLRALHDAMDRAVLDAYGWADLDPTCEFLLDYEDEDDDDHNSGRARQRKKPWRYRWPDVARDEILARLLALNEMRAASGPVRSQRKAQDDREC